LHVTLDKQLIHKVVWRTVSELNKVLTVHSHLPGVALTQDKDLEGRATSEWEGAMMTLLHTPRATEQTITHNNIALIEADTRVQWNVTTGLQVDRESLSVWQSVAQDLDKLAWVYATNRHSAWAWAWAHFVSTLVIAKRKLMKSHITVDTDALNVLWWHTMSKLEAVLSVHSHSETIWLHANDQLETTSTLEWLSDGSVALLWAPRAIVACVTHHAVLVEAWIKVKR